MGACLYIVEHGTYYLPTAPHAPPQSVMFEYDRDSPEMVFFSWQPPPPDQQNGVITRYDIVCTPSSGQLVNGISYYNALNATVGMFTPATQYSCTITASTRAGTGPGNTVTVVTCELMNWHLSSTTVIPDDWYYSSQKTFTSRKSIPQWCSLLISHLGQVRRQPLTSTGESVGCSTLLWFRSWL